MLAPWVALAAPPAKRGTVQEALGPLSGSAEATFANRPLVLIVALTALGLAPFVLMMVTSFVKISVVLSIVRSALGTQQIPPTQVITGLAIILTVYIMAPVGQEMFRVADTSVGTTTAGLMDAKTVDSLLIAGKKARGPLRDFLKKKVTTKDRVLFFSLALKLRKLKTDACPAEVNQRSEETRDEVSCISETDFLILTPAFVVSELKEAFQIGFLLFVPFLVIDMVVANILLALGMQMLSPTTISMPFKLLLFVLVDGWYLIAKGLVIGYL
ncbi:MAG: type III secretion system export apparatus subunit SctR [Archangium sp.]|nr:type III secretion system export apparatus subunit SctR [Archangium sp.]